MLKTASINDNAIGGDWGTKANFDGGSSEGSDGEWRDIRGSCERGREKGREREGRKGEKGREEGGERKGEKGGRGRKEGERGRKEERKEEGGRGRKEEGGRGRRIRGKRAGGGGQNEGREGEKKNVVSTQLVQRLASLPYSKPEHGNEDIRGYSYQVEHTHTCM